MILRIFKGIALGGSLKKFVMLWRRGALRFFEWRLGEAKVRALCARFSMEDSQR